MSKNQSRKGYVVGALVALVSTLFTVAPAQADANGPVTLLPTSGTTFNTIVGSPIELVSVQDPSTRTTTLASESANKTFYVIENPGKATIKIGFKTAPQEAGKTTFSYLAYAATGVATSRTSSEAVSFVSYAGTVTSTNYVITTTLSKIAVAAATSVSGAIKLNTITLDASASSAVTLTVQTLVDTDQTTVGAADPFDRVSKKETVVIYPQNAVPTTTKIVDLDPTSRNAVATVVYGNSVNPYFVAGETTVAFFKNGSRVTLASGVSVSPSLGDVQGVITSSKVTSVSAGVITVGYNSSDFTTLLNLSSASSWGPGVFAAQAYYDGKLQGAASGVWNGSAGPSATLDSVAATFIDSLDAMSESPTSIKVRSGIKTLTIGAQLYSASAELAASNVEVKLEVADSALDASTSIAVSGAVGTLTDGGDALTALARSDANGRASFTITSTTGETDDEVEVTVYAKAASGAWLAGDTITVLWEDASYSTFAPVSAYVSGANPSVTYKVTDQFGKGLSAIDGKPLTVYVEASFAGVAAPKTYSASAAVSGGQAKFTFANFAATNSIAQLNATLYEGTVISGDTVDTATVVNVYNMPAVDKVAVADSYTSDVTYVDFVTGDTTDPVVAKKVSDSGLDSAASVDITGTVLNTSNVGSPGAVVTVAAKGVLFLADGVYSLDTITTNANEFGAFSVTAIAHTVWATGTTVSVTAEGKTATTKLITQLPSGLTADDLKFSWTLPATVVKNTTYAVTLSLTDKWGNPVNATTASGGVVSVQGFGSLEINSTDAAVGRNFDKNGKATVFLRSVKDIAGPGSIAAELVSVFDYPGEDGDKVSSSTIVSSIATDDKTTTWNESLWSNELTSELEVLDSAPASAGKVNVGSFNGKLVVYAANLNGARISWKVGGNWGSAVATSNYAIFNRPTPRAGVTVSVEVFVNGVKTLTKSVVTR